MQTRRSNSRHARQIFSSYCCKVQLLLRPERWQGTPSTQTQSCCCCPSPGELHSPTTIIKFYSTSCTHEPPDSGGRREAQSPQRVGVQSSRLTRNKCDPALVGLVARQETPAGEKKLWRSLGIFIEQFIYLFNFQKVNLNNNAIRRTEKGQRHLGYLWQNVGRRPGMLHFVRLEMMEFSTSLSSGHVAIINTHIYKRRMREEQWGFSDSLIIICDVQMCIQTALEQNFTTVTSTSMSCLVYFPSPFSPSNRY